jgi:hypothetical protein
MLTNSSTIYCESRLRDHVWSVGYSSDKVDLSRDFYQPAMSVSIRYDRTFGDFSSDALALISRGIRDLYLRSGKIRLIASPVLSREDIERFRQGHSKSNAMIESKLLESLGYGRLDEGQYLQLRLLSGMLADGLLELQLAVHVRGEGQISVTHEGVGVFQDVQGDYITFIGSRKETRNAWVGNAESFELSTSWGS